MTRPDYLLVHAALSTRLAATSGLPAIAYANVESKPAIGTPYVTESLAPATSTVQTFGASTKLTRSTGLYAIGIYGEEGKDVSPNHAVATAIVAQFAGWKTTLSNGDVLRIRTDILPTPGGSRNTGDGWFFTPVNVFWQCDSQLTTS